MANPTPLSYTGRDQVDIRREMVSLVPSLTDKWKDFSPSDLGMVILELIAGAQDLQNFYFDNQAFETFVDLAEQDKNLRSHLRAMNYRIPFMGSAKGEINLYFNKEITKPLTIPKYTQLTCNNDLMYATMNTYVIDSSTLVEDENSKYYNLYKSDRSLDVMEGIVRSFTVTKKDLSLKTTVDGSISRRIYLEGGDSHNYSDKSLWINHTKYNESGVKSSITWEEVDDAILEYEGGNFFSVHVDSYGETYILMSVNFMDYLDESDEITIYWIQTLGLDGIATPGTDSSIDRFLSFKPEDINITVSQEEVTSGAYSIPKLKTLVPLARRQAQNIGRYITIDDFKNGVSTEPYVFKSVTKDWKSPNYVSIPYQVRVWAVDFNGNNLNSININTLKEKFYKKGVTDIEIVYMNTDFVKIRIDVNLHLKVSTETNQEIIRESVRTYLEDYFSYLNLDYGYKISLLMLDSQIRSVSSYIRTSDLNIYRGKVSSLMNYSGYTYDKFSSITITNNMSYQEKLDEIEKVRNIVNSDFVELSSDINIETLSSVLELEVIEWKEIGDIVLDEVEFPKIYQINVSSTQEDSGVEL